MKLIALTIIFIAGCSTATANDLKEPQDLRKLISRNWYMGSATSRTDYIIEHCKYAKNETFTCTYSDQGCSHGFCEAETGIYGGTWSVEGNTLLQVTIFGGSSTKHALTIKTISKDYILFAGGKVWYKSASLRKKHLYDSL